MNKINDIYVEEKMKNLVYLHYKKDDDIYLFFNESLTEECNGEITLPGSGILYSFDVWENKLSYVKKVGKDSIAKINIELKPYENSIFIMKTFSISNEADNEKKTYSNIKVDDLSNGWVISIARAIELPKFKTIGFLDELIPISEIDASFSGVIKYEKDIILNETPNISELCIENVFETVNVYLNDKLVGKKLTPPYNIQIGDEFCLGTNRLKVEVATTLEREQIKYPEPPFRLTYNAVEPTGMFGLVQLKKYF